MNKRLSKLFSVALVLALVISLLSNPIQNARAAGSISLTAIGSAYSENFDTLINTGSSSIVPTGWSFAESGTNANTTYTAGTGSSTSGDTYSFGATSSTERAFGGLQSGSLTPTIGASFTNNVGATLNQLAISYIGEQWRLGATSRVDRLDFQYSTNATSLTTGSWFDWNALDFTAPVTSGTVGALNGNLGANRTAISSTITGISIPNGSTFWIRWTDLNATGSDDGLAVDDFSLTAIEAAPSVFSTIPVANTTDVAFNADIVVTFSEPVNVTGDWYNISCATSGVHTAVVTGGPTAYTLNPDADFVNNELCTVTIYAALVSDQDLIDPPDTMVADYTWSFTPKDPAPFVTVVSPLNGTIGVAITSDLTVTFSEPVDVAAGWYTISCASSGVHTAAVTGGPTVFTLNPDIDFVKGELCTVTLENTLITDQDIVDPFDEMIADYTWSFTTTACGLPYTAISAVQGNSTTSPLVGSVISLEGIVTADLQLSSQLGGIFVQTVPGSEDTDPLTSEGIFTYTGSSYTSVTTGDRVRLTGTVVEYINTSNGQMARITEISPVSVLEICANSQPLPTPTVINLPDVADPAFTLEPYEGMLVSFPETLTVQQNYFQGRFGQLTLGAGGRIAQINNITKGGGSLFDYTRMLILDDGSHTQNLDPISYYPTYGERRAGDTVAGLVGVLDQGRINSAYNIADEGFPNVYYRLHPTIAPSFTQANPRPATPPTVGGRIKVVGTNVLNYFTTLDKAPFRSTAPYDGGSNTPRGADTDIELTRQQDKIVKALAMQDADVYGLNEIESWDGANGGTGAPQALVNALNAYLLSQGSPNVYAVIADPILGYFDPTEGGDYIQVAMIYKTNAVTPVGASLSTNDLIFDRSPFAQEFEEKATGEEFVVVANHFKSKSSCPTGDPYNGDKGDGQGCWNLKRVQQAQALVSFINASLLPLDQDVLVIGDLNSYGAEDPIATLITGGLVNQVAAKVSAASRYSYVFDGSAGYLDHALSTSSFSSQITGVAFWHINADEPSVIDYNTEYKIYPPYTTGSPDLYQPDQFMSSDHDPVIIGLNLANTANEAPTLANPIPDQKTMPGAPFTFTFNVNTFSDLDLPFGDILSYSATLADGSALPTWLTFTPATRTFSGTPASGDLGILHIKVVASDTALAQINDIFDLQVGLMFWLPLIGK